MTDHNAELLVIDDDPFFAGAARDRPIVRSRQIPTRQVHTVDAALDIIKENSFDLIIMDVRLPAGERFDTIERPAAIKAGVVLSREIRSLLPRVRLIV